MDRHLLCYKRMWVTGASGYGEVRLATVHFDVIEMAEEEVSCHFFQ